MLLAAGVVAAVAGVLVGVAAARLRGPYLAGATLALAVGLPALATKFVGLPRRLERPHGHAADPAASLGATFPLERWQAWIACLAALLTYVLLANLVRSGYGRALRAVRDDEIAAQLAGYHVARTQIVAFVVSAAGAGLAGGLLGRRHVARRAGRLPAQPVAALLTGGHPRRHRQPGPARLGRALLVLVPTWADDASKALSLSANVQANLALGHLRRRAHRRDARRPRRDAGGAARDLAGCSTASEPRSRGPRRDARRKESS